MTLDHAEKELELAALDLLGQLGWETADATHETFPDSFLGREHPGQVVLEDRLTIALARLNPDLPGEALGEALTRLTRTRPPGNPVRNNQDVYHLLREGARVEVHSTKGTTETVTVRYIDWDDPSANGFLAVRQFRVVGDLYTTIPDVVGFVNGIPLVFIEFKAPHVDVKHAYDDNLTHYRDQVPQLFWFNGLTILSNGGTPRSGRSLPLGSTSGSGSGSTTRRNHRALRLKPRCGDCARAAGCLMSWRTSPCSRRCPAG